MAYSYSGNNLTGFTDPLGNQTTFTYDSASRLTQIFYPSNPGVAFVTNAYDGLGRVKEQLDANGNPWSYYLAGTRTEIANPANTRQVSYQTPRGKVIKDAWVLSGSATVYNDTAQNNGVVNVWSNQYDGQDRLVLATAPERRPLGLQLFAATT